MLYLLWINQPQGAESEAVRNLPFENKFDWLTTAKSSMESMAVCDLEVVHLPSMYKVLASILRWVNNNDVYNYNNHFITFLRQKILKWGWAHFC